MWHRDTEWTNAIRKMVPKVLLMQVATNFQFVKITVTAKHNKAKYACIRSHRCYEESGWRGGGRALRRRWSGMTSLMGWHLSRDLKGRREPCWHLQEGSSWEREQHMQRPRVRNNEERRGRGVNRMEEEETRSEREQKAAPEGSCGPRMWDGSHGRILNKVGRAGMNSSML